MRKEKIKSHREFPGQAKQAQLCGNYKGETLAECNRRGASCGGEKEK